MPIFLLYFIFYKKNSSLIKNAESQRKTDFNVMIPNGVLRGSTSESVATFNAQGDMFKEPISDEVGFLIELFEKNTRTPSGISGVLNEYYNLVKNIDTTTQDIFGAENPSKVAELRAAYQKYSTSLAEEPNVSWRDTGEPTDAK